MKSVLLAAGSSPELAPLIQSTSKALLPVADKSLLVHAVESFAIAGIREVIVVVSAFAEQVRKVLGDGARWGLRLAYFPARLGESAFEALRRLNHELNEDYLVVRGDVLRTPFVARFLGAVSSFRRTGVEATIGGIPAGVSIVRRDNMRCSPIANRSLNDYPFREDLKTIDFPGESLSLIESPSALHRANLDAVEGRFPGLILPGRELSSSVMVGRKSRVPFETVKGSPLFVGARCRIAHNAELMSETVISSDCVIDRRAILRRAVVMPGTYVGAFIEVSNAIVAGNLLIDADTGATTRVTDAFMLSSIDSQPMSAAIYDAAARVGDMIRVALTFR